MAIEVVWRTQSGDRTPENRDFAGVGIRDGAVFCILLDGSTRGRDSGALVREIARGMVDAFVEGDRTENAGDLIDRLRDLSEQCARRWPQASASYVMAVIREDQPALILHAGDCLLGRSNPETGLEWLMRPDTLANEVGDRSIADIVNDPSRHRVTRGLRAREFMTPAVFEQPVQVDLVLATDGFWADLEPLRQIAFLRGDPFDDVIDGDDRSGLVIRILDEERAASVLGEDFDVTAYVRGPEKGLRPDGSSTGRGAPLIKPSL